MNDRNKTGDDMAKVTRRRFLQCGGVLTAATMLPVLETMPFAFDPVVTVRDTLWLWGHLEGSYDNSYGLPMNSRMTPLEGADYLGIPNIIMVRYDGKPVMPFDKYAQQYQNTKKLMWSFVGGGGGTSREEREHVLDIARTMPNITGLFMDDFFHGNAVPVQKCWLAENDVELPVTVSFRFPREITCDQIVLTQTNWQTGDYRTSDLAVDVLRQGQWNEVAKSRLDNQPGSPLALTLPHGPIDGLRVRLLRTHDIKGAMSVGLQSIVFWDGDQKINLAGTQVEATSSYPGHSPEHLLLDDNDAEAEPPAAWSIAELKEIRKKLALPDRTLDLGVTLYAHQLNPAIRRHLDLCDLISFWSWTADDLARLDENFAKYREIAPNKRTLLGIYMWDFGLSKPLPMELMQMQCQTALKWLKAGEIEGMIFLASNICNMKIETVEWSKEWVAKHGQEVI